MVVEMPEHFVERIVVDVAMKSKKTMHSRTKRDSDTRIPTSINLEIQQRKLE